MLDTVWNPNGEAMDVEKVLQVAEEAARVVGERMRTVVQSSEPIDVTHKGITDLVTEIDLWAEEEIGSRIKDAFPDHTMIGEEAYSGPMKAGSVNLPEVAAGAPCWVVDPLDGTTNFVNGIPHSAVSIGILHQGDRIAGVVYDPYRDELFSARRGAGARLNGRTIQAGRKTELIQAVIGTSFPHDNFERWSLYGKLHDAIVQSCRKVRVFGSAALEQCWVACGRLDAYLEYNLKPWDIAAGTLIVEESGARAACFIEPKEPIDILTSKSLLVAGSGIFDTLLELAHSTDRKARQAQRADTPGDR